MQEKNRDFSVFKKRILQYLEYKCISKYECYQNTGITNGVLSQSNGMSEDNILKFLSYYSDINPSWLLAGNGDMLKSKSTEINHSPSERLSQVVVSEDKDSKNPGIIQQTAEKNFSAPLYDVSASAGYGSFDEMIDREKLVGNFVIPGFTNIDWMIYVAGSSMYPKYSSGDIIACRVLHESRFIQWGKVYVLATREQGILVKRLKKCADENCLTAVCDNPAYDSFDVPKDEILGIALVVGVVRLE